MMSAAAVTIVLNGSIVAGVHPARIASGHVMVPLTPVLVRLASRVSYNISAATIALERGRTRIVVAVAFVDDDEPFVELRPVVQRLGGSAAFDTRTKTLSIMLGSDDAIATSPPFDPTQPQPEASPVFMPAPPPATPRPVDSSAPRPRRTAIPVTPSQPVGPPTVSQAGVAQNFEPVLSSRGL